MCGLHTRTTYVWNQKCFVREEGGSVREWSKAAASVSGQTSSGMPSSLWTYKSDLFTMMPGGRPSAPKGIEDLFDCAQSQSHKHESGRLHRFCLLGVIESHVVDLWAENVTQREENQRTHRACRNRFEGKERLSSLDSCGRLGGQNTPCLETK